MSRKQVECHDVQTKILESLAVSYARIIAVTSAINELPNLIDLHVDYFTLLYGPQLGGGNALNNCVVCMMINLEVHLCLICVFEAN